MPKLFSTASIGRKCSHRIVYFSCHKHKIHSRAEARKKNTQTQEVNLMMLKNRREISCWRSGEKAGKFAGTLKFLILCYCQTVRGDQRSVWLFPVTNLEIRTDQQYAVHHFTSRTAVRVCSILPQTTDVKASPPACVKYRTRFFRVEFVEKLLRKCFKISVLIFNYRQKKSRI